MEFWSLQTLLANDATQSFLDFLKDCNALRHKGTLEVRECSLFAHAQMSLCTDLGTDTGARVFDPYPQGPMPSMPWIVNK